MSSTKHKPHSITKFIIDFASSAIGGVVAKTVVAPLDRVKLILQIRRGLTEKYGELLPNLPKNRKTFNYTTREIIEKQGFFSLWRGNLANIVRYVPSQSIMFGLHKYIITLLTEHHLEHLTTRRIAEVSMLAGGLSAAICLAISYQLFICQSLITGFHGPLESAKYSTVYGCLANLYRKEGIRGWFRGFYISQATVIINRALFFGLYDLFKFGQFTNLNLPPTASKVIAAQAASILSSFVAYPVETVARRIIAEAGRSKKLYGTARHGFGKIFREEGIKGFFGGALINSFRSIGGAIVLLLHDELSILMLHYHHESVQK